MDPALIAKYDTQVPRYTSYPTAPHFTAEVDAGRYGQWLGALGRDDILSLYLHVPFCSKLCWYCGCNTAVVNTYEPVAAYKDLLLKEIDLVAEALAGRRRVTYVHWGGGTPTILTGDDFRVVSAALRERFEFTDDTEVAVEMDPRGVGWETIEALADSGVTRASVGVQDFDRKVQEAVNRIQPYSLTARVISQLRHAGITDINLDLMYGLPHQTVDSVIAAVDTAMKLEPQRVAVFGYAHVPWMKRHQRFIDERDLPTTAERWRMIVAVEKRFAEHGYVSIGLDHFARPDDDLARALAEDRLHRNFQGYTTDQADTILGLGASAIGTLPQGYVQNAPNARDYRVAITGGRLATVRGIAVTAEDRLRRDIIESLMCDLHVDLDEVCARHRVDAGRFAGELAALQPLEEDGLVTVANHRVTVTEAGRPLVRTICAAFDTYLTTSETRHAKAV